MADTTLLHGAPTPDDSHLPGLADLFSDIAAVLAWRCDLGTRLAGGPASQPTAEERFVHPHTARRLGL